MYENMAYRLTSKESFDTVVENLERECANNQFRVLHVHDVQATLADKGFERGPMKIVEVCNAGFAHEALKKETGVALFMPCRYEVHTEGDETVVTLALPTMISQMMPQAGLEQLAANVEATLKKVMEDSV